MQRILIVDDNEDIREVLGTYVAKEGFEPVVAKDGFEALDLFKKANPAVVLLDVMMPGMDGYKVCEKIREQSDVPIILVTAKGDDYDCVMDWISEPMITSSNLLMEMRLWHVSVRCYGVWDVRSPQRKRKS